MELSETAKSTILKLATCMQQGEIARERGSLNVGLLRNAFDYKTAITVGQQRIDAAFYLYSHGVMFADEKDIVLTKEELDNKIQMAVKDAVEDVCQQWYDDLKDRGIWSSYPISLAQDYGAEIEQ